MPFSFRLDPQTSTLIRRIARRRKCSQSAVVREAVAHFGAAEQAGTHVDLSSAFDRMTAFIGVANTHGANLSTATHEKFRAALERKQRDRRTR